MKMKNLIYVVIALIVAGLVFGGIMFFIRRNMDEIAERVGDVSEDSEQIEKEIEEIPVEYILMQINYDPQKSYVCTGFLYDKRGNRHYFDLTGRADLSAEEIYAEAVKQSGYYEPEEYIYKGDIPLVYSRISSIDPEKTAEVVENNSIAETKVFYAILSDGVKTYPVAVYGEGQKTVNTSDTNSQNLAVYIRNLLDARNSDSTFVPVPTAEFNNDMAQDDESSEEETAPESE